MVESPRYNKRDRNFIARPGEFTYKQREAARRSPCAYCGATTDPEKGIIVEGHHPIPTEWVGDSIVQIPVPLCRGGKDGGCHSFFDSLVYDTGVTYHEYVAETERLRRKDRHRENTERTVRRAS